MLVRNLMGSSKRSWENDEDGPFLCGCEYEVEDILDYKGDFMKNSGISVVEDHSLRNNGREFVTSIHSFEDQLEIFKGLHKNIIVGKEPFSERTSIHVHVNVRSFSTSKLKQFVLLYALVEPLFFNFVGDTRKNSIYCVPLSATYLPSIYCLDIQTIINKWHKYTALNLLPILGGDGSKKLGSVEFRHMYGTSSVNEFSVYLEAIKNLYDKVNFELDSWKVVDGLSTKEDTYSLIRSVLPTLSAGYTNEELLALTKNTQIDVKLSEVL